MAGRTFPLPVRAVALMLCAAFAGACSGSTPPPLPSPQPVLITVDGASHQVAPGTTFGALVHDLHLHASTGRLLSVSGTILNHFADPGRLLLNGTDGFGSTMLVNGDVVRVVNGKNRTEGLRRTSVNIGRRVGDPEFTLDTYPTAKVTVTGAISGDLVSITDVSKGHGIAPRAVALTFDDGPWPVDTSRVLAVLKRYHVPATFFEVGYLVQRYPNIVHAVLHAGEQVENHSFDHPISPPLADLSDTKITSEISVANLVLKPDGAHPTLFRPPGGSFNDFVVQEARTLGMRVVLWNVDPRDWVSARTAQQVTSTVMAQVKPGSIILLHDGGGDAAHTIKALPAIIRGIRRRGLHFVFVPALPA
jgi:peptidoglycan/xylan/chitin deacetylase (PgdA/CDA1 family)